MGIAKKTDGRYVVGVGVDNANDYRGSAAYRDIYIQLTSSGATEQSEEYLTFLKDYAVNANASGEPIMPPSVNVWISNNGVTTAVEADDVSIDGNNYTICGIKWNGSTWDYSGAGQGKSGSGLPPYTSADKGKVLTVGEDAEHTTEMTAVPQQDITEENGEAVITNVDTSLFGEGYAFTMTINNSTYTGAITKEYGQLTANVVPDPDGDAYFAIVAGDPDTYFYTNEDGTYSVKLTIAVPNAKDVWDYVKADELVIYNSGSAMVIKGHEEYSYDEFFIELNNAITNKKPTVRVYKDNALVPCNISVDNNTMRTEFTIYSGIEKEMYVASRSGMWTHYTTILVPDASILPNGTYQLTKTTSGVEWTAVT